MVMPVLPLVPAFLALASPPRPRVSRPEDDALMAQKPRITRALLGDAMLGADDLRGAWVQDDAHISSRSFFAGTEYESLFLTDLQVRMSRAETAEFLEQHVAVLPDWAIGPFAGDLDGVMADGLGGVPGGDSHIAHTAELHLPPIADQKFAVRVAITAGNERPVSTDAVVLRRGALVMALAYWHADGGFPHAAATASLAVLADRKWLSTAEALR